MRPNRLGVRNKQREQELHMPRQTTAISLRRRQRGQQERHRRIVNSALASVASATRSLGSYELHA
ncbi:MAG: hypothetical protein AB8A46_04085 [Prochlorococcus sp.]|nr:hypothetical protein [Prochlorococcus sp.]